MSGERNPATMCHQGGWLRLDWRLLLLAVIGALVVTALYAFDAGHTFTLANLKAQQAALQMRVQAAPLAAAAIFFVLYLTAVAVALPGTLILTLAGGALFGLVPGLLLVSFSSALGATLCFLVSRFILRDWVQRRFGTHLAAFNRGIERDGAFYLIFLGLTPVFPYFLINLVMGITPMRVFTFYWASQAGMLIETILVVNAGTELARVESLAGLFSPALLISLALIGLVPLGIRWLLAHEKMPARWRRTIDKQP